MKKQILFLGFFTLALIFAGTTKSDAQCSNDALHPMAGQPYHYVITTSGGGAVKSYEWIVTTTAHIVATGTLVSPIAQGATTYTMTGGSTADATITWSPTLIAAAMGGTDYYVVIKYVATNSEGCDIDNIKAYKIKPVNVFQIDLANVKVDGSPLASGNVCASSIVDAVITPGATPTITYDYGLSSMYVKVTARNFSGSWNMTVDATLLANLGASETAKLYWARTIGGTETAVTPGTAAVIPEATASPADDEVIYLRLEVDHNTFEGLTTEAFKFIVNGIDQVGNPDLSSLCVAEADEVTQTILERPTVTNGTVVGGFILP
jgi:hypothetical protein